jgi:hypothetical protein
MPICLSRFGLAALCCTALPIVGCDEAGRPNTERLREHGASKGPNADPAATAHSSSDPAVVTTVRPTQTQPNENENDAAAGSAIATSPDAAASSAATGPDAAAGSAIATSDARSDAALTPSADVGASLSTTANAHETSSCAVHACNDHGHCIDLEYGLDCACDPQPLPQCEAPLFRTIGATKNDYEYLMLLMSGDGRVVAGSHGFPAAPTDMLPVIWSAEDGLQVLEQDPAGTTYPTGVNIDGSVIAGAVYVSDTDESIPVIWRNGVLSRATPEDELPTGNPVPELPDGALQPEETFRVMDATPDGRLVVGSVNRPPSSHVNEAALWSADQGVRLVRDVMADHGMTLTDWALWHVNAISDDGRTLFGMGIGPASGYRWHLRLPSTFEW